MARTRTVNDLIADVRYRADVEGQTQRHPEANIQRLVNESWQALREMVSDQGYPYYLKAVSGTATAGVITPDSVESTVKAAFGSLAYPSDAIRVYGIDIQYNGRLISLEPLPFTARGDHQDTWTGDATGVPYGFYVYNVGTETTTTVAAGKIAIVPAPEAAYKYTIWYLPSWTDISTTSVFNGVAGWEEWVIWDVVVKLSARDNDRKNTYQIATAERDRIKDRISRSVDKLQRSGARVVQDTRGRRILNRARGSSWWST